MIREDKYAVIMTVLWFLGSMITNIEWCLCFAVFTWPYWVFLAWSSSDSKRAKGATVIFVLVVFVVAVAVASRFGQILRGAVS